MSGLIPDMEILLAGGITKAAKNLEVGDKLETLHQDTLKKGEHEVTYVRVIESPLLSLNFLGKEFTCAEEDRFYSTNKKGWLKATELKKGDKISQLEGELEFQESKKLGKGQSVELTVDEAHTYVSEGVLLHNKGGGGSPPPPPPPPKIYTQKAYDKKLAEAKAGWQTDADTRYDTRLAGDKNIWQLTADKARSDWELERNQQYAADLEAARGDWRTAADARYDKRLGEAKTGWHDLAEARYVNQLAEARTGWQADADVTAAANKATWDKKYADLDTSWGSKYDQQASTYKDRSKGRRGAWNIERGDLLDQIAGLQDTARKEKQDRAGGLSIGAPSEGSYRSGGSFDEGGNYKDPYGGGVRQPTREELEEEIGGARTEFYTPEKRGDRRGLASDADRLHLLNPYEHNKPSANDARFPTEYARKYQFDV